MQSSRKHHEDQASRHFPRSAILDPARPDVLDRQIETAKEVLRKNGWDLVSAYHDIGSGLRVDRTGLQQMLNDARQGLFDVVVVTNFSRITRSTTKLTNIIHDLEALGVSLNTDPEQFKAKMDLIFSAAYCLSVETGC